MPAPAGAHRADPERLARVRLGAGAHGTPEEGLCLMEAVAWVHHLPHTRRPAGVAEDLCDLGTSLNDQLDDGRRQELVRLIPALPSADEVGPAQRRGYLALDWVLRTWLPIWLALAPWGRDAADRLRGLPPVVDVTTAGQVGAVVDDLSGRTSARARALRSSAHDEASREVWGVAYYSAYGTTWTGISEEVRELAWRGPTRTPRAALAAAHEQSARTAGFDAVFAAVWEAALPGAASRGAAELVAPAEVAVLESVVDLYDRMARGDVG